MVTISDNQFIKGQDRKKCTALLKRAVLAVQTFISHWNIPTIVRLLHNQCFAPTSNLNIKKRTDPI